MPPSFRQAVVDAARAWIGTPYHACADVKGVGVDCGMLIVRIFVDLGLCAPFDPRPYPPDWHLHRAEEKYLGFVLANCRERAADDPAAPGDIAVFRFGRCWAHGGIVTQDDPLTIVHAYAPARCTLEEAVGRNLRLRATVAPRLFTLRETA